MRVDNCVLNSEEMFRYIYENVILQIYSLQILKYIVTSFSPVTYFLLML